VSDPLIDLSKLKAIKEWSADLADELKACPDLLPCKNRERMEDCLLRQKIYMVEEMRPTKMCQRCKARWHALMASKIIEGVYAAKTERVRSGTVDWS